jgi:hypothetical protein
VAGGAVGAQIRAPMKDEETLHSALRRAAAHVACAHGLRQENRAAAVRDGGAAVHGADDRRKNFPRFTENCTCKDFRNLYDH